MLTVRLSCEHLFLVNFGPPPFHCSHVIYERPLHLYNRGLTISLLHISYVMAFYPIWSEADPEKSYGREQTHAFYLLTGHAGGNGQIPITALYQLHLKMPLKFLFYSLWYFVFLCHTYNCFPVNLFIHDLYMLSNNFKWRMCLNNALFANLW